MLPQVSPRELGKLVERVDLNGDGAINFDEFAASLVDWQQVSRHPQLLLSSRTLSKRLQRRTLHSAVCGPRALATLQCGCPPCTWGSWYPCRW
jgi:hypothetical protein